MAWEWHWSGMGVAWEWHGSGMGVAWEWHGSGMGVAWEWHGSGMSNVKDGLLHLQFIKLLSSKVMAIHKIK